jgi:PKD repeat protein
VRKEVDQLLAFFMTDPTATPWFLRKTDQPPVLSVSGSPLAGQAPLKVTFAADASSPSATRHLAWSFGDGCYSLGPAATKTFHLPGTYDVRVTATDSAGNAATRTVTVKVEGVCSPPRKGKHYPAAAAPPAADRPPTVAITSPANGATFDHPKRIVVAAEAADMDGSVKRVDFFKGGATSRNGAWRVWLGQVARAPYSVVWDYDRALEYDPAGGTFILTARATDDLGATAEHSVTITIRSGE